MRRASPAAAGAGAGAATLAPADRIVWMIHKSFAAPRTDPNPPRPTPTPLSHGQRHTQSTPSALCPASHDCMLCSAVDQMRACRRAGWGEGTSAASPRRRVPRPRRSSRAACCRTVPRATAARCAMSSPPPCAPPHPRASSNAAPCHAETSPAAPQRGHACRHSKRAVSLKDCRQGRESHLFSPVPAMEEVFGIRRISPHLTQSTRIRVHVLGSNARLSSGCEE